jgi:hypothetical protein
VTLAFLAFHVLLGIITALGFHAIERVGRGSLDDLLKAVQLALLLLGPFVASGMALVVGTIAGIRMGRRRA